MNTVDSIQKTVSGRQRKHRSGYEAVVAVQIAVNALQPLKMLNSQHFTKSQFMVVVLCQKHKLCGLQFIQRYVRIIPRFLI